MHPSFLGRVTRRSMLLACLCGGAAAAETPPASMSAPVPRIERVVPLEQDPAVQGSFFSEDFEVEVAEGAQKPLKPDKMYDGVPGSYHLIEIDCTVVWKSGTKPRECTLPRGYLAR